jgi:hypothetical protein
MKRGYRKMALGFFYLAGVFLVAVLVVLTGNGDLTSAGVFAGGAAAGVAALVYGNVKEHEAAAKNDVPQGEDILAEKSEKSP